MEPSYGPPCCPALPLKLTAALPPPLPPQIPQLLGALMMGQHRGPWPGAGWSALRPWQLLGKSNPACPPGTMWWLELPGPECGSARACRMILGRQGCFCQCPPWCLGDAVHPLGATHQQRLGLSVAWPGLAGLDCISQVLWGMLGRSSPVS